MSATPRTWLITGCSTGFGRALVEVLIAKGERVFATARQPESLADLVDGHDNARALKLDVTSAAGIQAVIAELDQAGGVDVLVNNAGYGYLTADRGG
jgi:NAD(P)-dependent dehydrogenase (short-subunit alcohol dehydrogenase family)